MWGRRATNIVPSGWTAGERYKEAYARRESSRGAGAKPARSTKERKCHSSPSPKNKRIREELVCKWGVSGGEESLSTERRQRATRGPARAEARAHVSNRIEAGERLVSLGALRQALSTDHTGAGVALLFRDRHARGRRDRCNRLAARRANASVDRYLHGRRLSATAQYS